MRFISYKSYAKNRLRIYSLTNYLEGGFCTDKQKIIFKKELKLLKFKNKQAIYWEVYENLFLGSNSFKSIKRLKKHLRLF